MSQVKRAVTYRCLVFALAACPVVSGQNALIGEYPLKPVVLSKALIAQLPVGRPALREGTQKLNLHKSVPIDAELVPGRRKGSYMLQSPKGSKLASVRLSRPLEVTLDYEDQKRRHRWMLSLDAKNQLKIQSLVGASLRLGGVDLLFLDLDHDGAFGGLWDGFIQKERGERNWVPKEYDVRFRSMKAAQLIGEETVWFRVDRSGLRVTVQDEEPDYSVDRHEQNIEAMDILNVWRKALGIAPVKYDYKLASACERHAIYCLNHGITNLEMKSRIGYSLEGARAGEHSVITKAETMRIALDSYLHSFYHRIDMLSPRLLYVGMGVLDGFAVMEVRTRRDKRDFAPYMWPYAGMTGVPTGWDQGEAPSPTGEVPFDMRTAMRYGYPITVTFPDAEFTNVTVRLLEKGKDLDPFVTTPEKPGSYEVEDNLNSILIMSRRRLRSKTTYEVVVKCSWHGRPFQRAWGFKTR